MLKGKDWWFHVSRHVQREMKILGQVIAVFTKLKALTIVRLKALESARGFHREPKLESPMY